MRTKTLVLLLSLIMVAVVSRADSAEIVMGAVKAISANSITLETIGKAPKSVVVTVLPSTRFVKDGADASVKDLKLDDRVVVSVKANGDKFEAVRVVFGQMFQHMDMHHK